MSFSDKKLTKARLEAILDGSEPGPGDAVELADLGDVSIEDPENNQVLLFNGEGWVNADVVVSFLDLNDTPDTVLGYGITDAATHVAVPAGPTATGALGQYAVDADFAYFATGTDTWIRVAKDETWV